MCFKWFLSTDCLPVDDDRLKIFGYIDDNEIGHYRVSIFIPDIAIYSWAYLDKIPTQYVEKMKQVVQEKVLLEKQQEQEIERFKAYHCAGLDDSKIEIPTPLVPLGVTGVTPFADAEFVFKSQKIDSVRPLGKKLREKYEEGYEIQAKLSKFKGGAGEYWKG